jgi:hypothetical protein
VGADGEPEVNNYGQKMPATLVGEMMGGGQDAPLMPIHFQYNFLNRQDIPLHNEEFSKPSILLDSAYKKATTFFDNSLDVPSHVIL